MNTQTNVNEFLAEELTRVSKSKSKTEMQLARVKNKIRKHQANMRKMKQRLREMIERLREEEAICETAQKEHHQLMLQIAEDMDI